jgi:hypothetical protein
MSIIGWLGEREPISCKCRITVRTVIIPALLGMNWQRQNDDDTEKCYSKHHGGLLSYTTVTVG